VLVTRRGKPRIRLSAAAPAALETTITLTRR
jgi:hypothetical protein